MKTDLQKVGCGGMDWIDLAGAIAVCSGRSPDQTTLEGSSCTSIMTYTRGSGYSF